MLLDELKKQRDRLASSLKDVKPEVAKRSAYNLIYGISVFSFFHKQGLVNLGPKQKKRQSKIEKVKFVLNYLQEHYAEFFCVDLPEYDKDDYTIKFEEALLLEVVGEVHKLSFDDKLQSEEFWRIQEEFFISSF